MHSAYILWCQVSSSKMTKAKQAIFTAAATIEAGLRSFGWKASAISGAGYDGFGSPYEMLETYIMLAALQAALAQTHLNRVHICTYITCRRGTCEAHCRSLSCSMLRPAPKEASSLKKELSLLPTIQAVPW